MFTGIVDHCGTVTALERGQNSLRLTVSCEFTDLVQGESIAVDGCCLTVVNPSEKLFHFDLSPETLKLTVASSYEVGAKVNLERALRMGDRLGGHIVTGHVDSTGVVSERENVGEYVRFQFRDFPQAYRRYLHKKGSVAILGTSLTVNDVAGDSFEVALVPHTLERTTLGLLKAGAQVNMEFYWMTKIILNDVDKFKEVIK